MLEELNCDYIIINGSLSGNIDTLRNDIKNFASSVSLTNDGRKYVILDESDFLNPSSTQPALRNFMEEYSKNCGFILTCNYPSKILKELKSRCSTIEFKIPQQEKNSLANQFLKRIIDILNIEKVEYDKSTLVAVITKYFPDWRKILNELQRYSAIGKIDSGILSDFSDSNIKSLIEYMKNKDFTNVRKWVAENSDLEPVEILNKFYEKSSELFDSKTIPFLVCILAKYSYQSAFVAHQEINTAACLSEIMVECRFK